MTVDEIVAAARTLGFTVEPEPEKNYPRRPFRYEGRVKVDEAGRDHEGEVSSGRSPRSSSKTHPVHRKG